MTGQELAAKCRNLAENYRTLYVLGCFGAPLHAANRQRYTQNLSFNRKSARAKKINAASADTFGFDCVCMIKGLLWGWEGDTGHIYGGAAYASSGVPDVGADKMISLCRGISTDFSRMEVGEAVWFPGHIGVYIGDGLAVECTYRWDDGVQITAVHNIGRKAGYNGRYWTKHGKLPWVDYGETAADDTLTVLIRRVQEAVGAAVDGIAGPETVSKTVTLSRWKNTRHPAVKPVQEYLFRLGYTQVGTADGIAGPKFDKAVRAYQKDHGCIIDGEITAGNKTWKCLLGIIDN